MHPLVSDPPSLLPSHLMLQALPDWELTVILHVMPVRAFGVRPHCWVMDAQPGMSTGFWVHRICLDTQCILVPTQPALLKLHSLDPLTDETEGALLSG